MAKGRKRRTSIRTAAGTAQEAFLQRVRAVREDPTLVLPECPYGEPAAVAKVRRRLERIARKGPGFLDRRDKGLVGAVAHAWGLAEMKKVSRLMDAKVGGQRRFYLQRGHVERNVSMGVQNHDDPRALLLAYRPLAKKEGLHFFARPGLVCTGEVPRPPEAWLRALGQKGGVDLEQESEDLWSDGRKDVARVRLGFRGGPALAFAEGPSTGTWHGLVTDRYAGPRQRQPVEVDVLLPGGTLQDPDPKDTAAYRAGVLKEKDLIAKGLARWREETGSGRRYVLQDKDFREDQEAFLDALGAKGWQRTALAAMTEDGHRGGETTAAAVLEAHADRLTDGVAALLDPEEAPAFVQLRLREPVPEVLRKAHEEAQARQRTADLPTLVGLGPVGAWFDATVRAARRHGNPAGLEQVRRALDRGDVPRAHLWAVLRMLGGALDVETRFSQDEKEAGESLLEGVRRLFETTGEDYAKALAEHLKRSGTGEQVARAA